GDVARYKDSGEDPRDDVQIAKGAPGRIQGIPPCRYFTRKRRGDQRMERMNTNSPPVLTADYTDKCWMTQMKK
ncbi:MAG: hypothetical protein LBD09_05230, partial [Treponema sp.]|nr:hypothetical protein [Treponema sp.]